jgi:hypothetical protein
VALFRALDAETDARIAAQLQATLGTLLAAGASAQPSHWIGLLGSVALASGGTAARCAPRGSNRRPSPALPGPPCRGGANLLAGDAARLPPPGTRVGQQGGADGR